MPEPTRRCLRCAAPRPQRRPGRARQVLRARASLVGSRRASSSRCTTSTRCASRWIERIADGLAGKRVARCRLRRRHPRRIDGVARRDGDRRRPVGESARCRAAASIRVGIDRRLPLRQRPKRWRSRCRRAFDVVGVRWSCSSTCPSPARRSPHARRSRGPAASSCSRRSTAIPSRTCRRCSAPSICCDCCRAARTTGRASCVRRSSPASRAACACELITMTGMTYNPLTKVYRLHDDVGQLPGRVQATSCRCDLTRARCRSSPCCSISTERWRTSAGDLAGAVNRIRRRARHGQTLYRCIAAPTRRPARASLLGAGMGVVPGDASTPVLRGPVPHLLRSGTRGHNGAVRRHRADARRRSTRAACAGAS